MKIFKNWRQRKSRQGEQYAEAAAASNTTILGCLQAHQLHECDYHQLSLSGADDAPPYFATHYSSMINGNYDMRSEKIEDQIPCPQNYPEFKQAPMRKKEDINTVNNDYDMGLLIYQYTVQNAFLSIGTLGAELLSKLAAEMNDDDSTITSDAEKDCLEGASSTEKNTTSQIHPIYEVDTIINGVTSSEKMQVEMLKPSCLEQEIMCESSIISSSYNTDAAFPVEKLTEGQNLSLKDFVKGISMHEEGSASNSITFEDNPTTSRSCPASSGSPQETIGNEGIKTSSGNSQGITSGTPSMSAKRNMMGTSSPKLYLNEKNPNNNTNESLSINELGLNILLKSLVPTQYPCNGNELVKDMDMEEFLMGLYEHQEVAQTLDEVSGRKSTRNNIQGMIMGCSRNDEGSVGSSRSEECRMSSSMSDEGSIGSSLRSEEWRMSSSSSTGNGMIDSSASAQGMMDSSYTAIAQGIEMGSSMFSQGMKSLEGKRSKENIKQKGPTIHNDEEMNMDNGIMGSCRNSRREVGSPNIHAKSFDGRETRGEMINGELNDDEKDEMRNVECDQTLNCLRIVSSNYHLNLKRLILSVTPHHLSKHLLKRLKVAQRHMMGRPDFNYHSKIYKEFMHMFRMKRKHWKKSSMVKRELGPPTIEEEVQSKGNDEEINIQEIMSETSSSMQNLKEIHNENWISTDDEYVVLELEENKH